MTEKNHKDILLEEFSNRTYLHKKLPDELLTWINSIATKAYSQKGVYTVLITLLVHKIFDPDQDVRCHQSGMEGGFSGRSIDTKYITPTLKEINLPSMSESGWLTRSLEQPYPYNIDYNGKISGGTKDSFLNILKYIEEKNFSPSLVLRKLLELVYDEAQKNLVTIIKLENPDDLIINQIISFLGQQFFYKYNTNGGSKLPVISMYSILEVLLLEQKRYLGCQIPKLGSHTASDKTSKTSGDIEIFKNNELFETFEIKLDKKIDAHMLRTIREKIIKFNPTRYYILSCIGVKKDEINEINAIINEVKREHGCQIIVNGVLDTIKYYLRLIDKCDIFISNYLEHIEHDKELKLYHKEITNSLVKKFFNK